MPKKIQHAMVFLLAILMLVAVLMRVSRPADVLSSLLTHPVQNGFLFGLPLVLIGFVVAGARWALMAAVMYGTIGLAWDISTVVQEVAARVPEQRVLLMSGMSGLLNLSLVLVGGRGFLNVDAASPGTTAGRPPEGHRPNPPSPPGA